MTVLMIMEFKYGTFFKDWSGMLKQTGFEHDEHVCSSK